MDKKIIGQAERYYTQKAEQYGATSRGVDWNSEESQRLRFEKLTGILQQEGSSGFSVCDYGCGYGSYAAYLKEKGYDCAYTGLDVSEKMIELARQTYGGLEHTIFRQDSSLQGMYDYIVASGIFNVRQDVGYEKWTAYMTEILERFHQHTEKGFAFNCLTKYSDAEFMKDYLYYADPLYYFDYAKSRFSRNVALLHDYGLYEFTILVRKKV